MKRESFMMRAAEAIVRFRWFLLLLFAGAIVFSCFSVRWIKVENDITFYLAEDAEARRGLSIMEDEFSTLGSAQVMVKQVSPEEAAAIAEELRAVEDVALVSWDGSERHYRDGNALFDVTFDDTVDSEKSERALEAVRATLSGRDVTIHSEVGFSLAALIAEQMAVVLVFVVIVVLAVLLFTSSTYAEIPVMILTFVVAAFINMGTSFLMGTISFVSNSVAIVLQLALSVDYAIIFCNRYKEEHEKLPIREAVVKALAASIPEISASSLTTIAGLTAMTFMKFRLGGDMGVNLIKAIVCSLLTVFLFMPAMLMLFGPLMDKSGHRRFVPKISFVGRFAYATRHFIPVLFVGLVVLAYVLVGRVPYAYCVDIVPSFLQTDYEAGKAEIDEAFGGRNMVAVLVPSGDFASERALLEDLSECPEVSSASGLATVEARDGFCLGDEIGFQDFAQLADVDETTARALFAYYAAEQGEHWAATEGLESYRAPLIDLFLFLYERAESGDVELTPEQKTTVEELYGQLSMAGSQLRGEHYSRLVLELELPIQSEQTFSFLERIHVLAARYYADGVCLTGDSVSAKDFKISFASDNRVVGLMSLGLVMLILFFTFRSFGMPLLLILVIQGSIWMNFAIAALRGTPVFFLCYLIVGAIQMGANIDYAIVVSTRYREFRNSMEPREAIITTMNLAFPTLITSGLMMVCAGLLIGFRVSQCIIAGMGYYVGVGTSISLVLILFALPQLLLLGDRFVALTTINPEKLGLAGFWRRQRRRIGAALLAAAAVFALLLLPGTRRTGADRAVRVREQNEKLLERTAGLKELADRLNAESTLYASLKYKFAEQLVTDEIGGELLAQGEAEYEAGLEQYLAGKERYDEGAEKLADAKAEYKEGAAQLAAGQAAYDAGLAEYQNALAQYQAGKQRLAEGQAVYDAGLAEYEAGKAEYAAGEQRLAEGQAAYDEGQAAYEQGKAEVAAGEQRLAEGQAAYDAGLARYNEGKAQYDEAKAALDSAAGLYYAVLPFYNEYQSLQSRYDEAVARGDLVSALALTGPLAAAKLAFETQLGDYSIGGLVASYQDAQRQLEEAAGELAAAEQQLAEGKAELDAGYAEMDAARAQLADAEQQLAAGKAELDAGKAELAAARAKLTAAEQQLAAGKAELDAGYAQLADAEGQLAVARGELDAAKAQLDQGYAQLDQAGDQIRDGDEQLAEAAGQLSEGEAELAAAKEELDSGQNRLEENREQLNESLQALDNYSSEEERLTEGVNLLMEDAGVKRLTGRLASTGEVLRAAEQSFRQNIEQAEGERGSADRICRWLLIAAALGLLAVLVWLLHGAALSAALAALSALTALLSFVFWQSRCAGLGGILPYAALLLMACAMLFAELMIRRGRGETPAGDGDAA